MNKIIFLGTPGFAVPILDKIKKNKYEIISVFTQPPKKSSRGQKVLKSAVQLYAENFKLDVKTPENIKNEENFIKDSKIDLGIVVAYGQIIPKKILNSCKYGFINIHASLLPKYRGAAPIQRSLINLDKFTGISIMKINSKLDSGPVCNQYKIPIGNNDNLKTLSEKLSQLGANNIIRNIELICSENAKFKEQDHSIASYANKIQKQEGKINWNENAKNIIGKINGLFPNPGVWFEFQKERYKILKSEFSEVSGKPGEVLDDILTVGCGNHSIKIKEIQKQGKKIQKTLDFLRGNKIKKGSLLNDE